MIMLVMVGVSRVVALDYDEGEIAKPLDYPNTDKIVQLVGESVKRQLKRMGIQIYEHLTSLEEKVNAVKAEMEQLKQQEEASKEEVKAEVEQLKQQQEEMMIVISSLAKEATLATKIEEVVALQLVQVSQKINNMRQECISCGKADNLAQVLNLVNSTKHSLTTLTQQMDNTSHTRTTSCSQGCDNVIQTLEEQARERCEAATTLTEELQTAVDNIQNQLVKVVNYTSPSPPRSTLAPTPGGSGERTPCEDSTFVGVSPNFNVCTTAVEFKRCRVNILAYHCCRTCTRSGQIPVDGAWRFYNLPRVVKRIQTLQLMTMRN